MSTKINFKEKLSLSPERRLGRGGGSCAGSCSRGASLVFAARNDGALNEAKADGNLLGAQALVVIADTSDAKTMIRLASAAVNCKTG